MTTEEYEQIIRDRYPYRVEYRSKFDPDIRQTYKTSSRQDAVDVADFMLEEGRLIDFDIPDPSAT